MLTNQAMRNEMLRRIQRNIYDIQTSMEVLNTLDTELDLHDQIAGMTDGTDKLFEATNRAEEINDLLGMK